MSGELRPLELPRRLAKTLWPIKQNCSKLNRRHLPRKIRCQPARLKMNPLEFRLMLLRLDALKKSGRLLQKSVRNSRRAGGDRARMDSPKPTTWLSRLRAKLSRQLKDRLWLPLLNWMLRRLARRVCIGTLRKLEKR